MIYEHLFCVKFLARLRKNSGDGDMVPAMENPMSFRLLEVGVQMSNQTPVRMFHYLCAFLGIILSALLALMGLLLLVFRRRTNDNELAASPGPPLTAVSHSVPAFSPEEPSPSPSPAQMSLVTIWLPSSVEIRTIDIGSNSNLILCS